MLVVERNWLTVLILLQLLKVIAFAVFSPRLTTANDYSRLRLKQTPPVQKPKHEENEQYGYYINTNHQDEIKQTEFTFENFSPTHKLRSPLTPVRSPKNELTY